MIGGKWLSSKSTGLGKRKRSMDKTKPPNRIPNLEINKGRYSLFQRTSFLDPGKWKNDQNLARSNSRGGYQFL
jgi:hypothetical protein